MHCATKWLKCLFAALIGSMAAHAAPAAAQVTRLADASHDRSMKQARLIGVSSCMAASCHGGAETGSETASRQSYTTWFARDPHAGAYEALWNNRSRRMVALLSGQQMGEEVTSAQHLQLLQKHGCLACHATAGGEGAVSAHVSEGVSCESCHGPAGQWVQSHYLTRWTSVPDEEKLASGMRATKNLSARAQVCMPCHVGGPETADAPRREVNHDLIAAGHPRLNFEFAAYLANLPPHWDAEKDRQRTGEKGIDFEAAAWLTGQHEAKRAVLALLHDQAQRAAAETEPLAAWPEFSQYDCFACHHGLKEASFRLTETTNPPGRLLWGSWYFALGDRTADSPLAKLTSAMQRGASPDEISELSNAAVKSLSEQESNKSTLLRMLSRPADESWRWDQYVQWYLGLRAIEASLQGRAVSTQPLSERLKQLSERLQFPKGFDSAVSFDPSQSAFRDLVESLRKELSSVTPQAAPQEDQGM